MSFITSETSFNYFLSNMEGSELRLEGAENSNKKNPRHNRRYTRKNQKNEGNGIAVVDEVGGSAGGSGTDIRAAGESTKQKRHQNRRNDQKQKQNQNQNQNQIQNEDKSHESTQSDQPKRKPDQNQKSGPNQKQKSSQQITTHQKRNQRRLPKREYELKQILDAYGIADSYNGPQTSTSSTNQSTVPSYSLALAPSDPEFPFDIEFLLFKLYLPLDYPNSKPWISVENSDIPKGFSANIESGFRAIALRQEKYINLLKMIKELDVNLEKFLKMEKQETIKIVKHKVKRVEGGSSNAGQGSTAIGSTSTSSHISVSSLNPTTSSFIPKAITEKRKRQMDILIKRLGELAKYNPQASTNEIHITINPPPSEILPPTLESEFTALLYIPNDYGISPCTISLPNHDDASLNVMSNFNAHSQAVTKTWSLLALVNYLSVELENLMLPNWVSDKQQKEGEVRDRTIKEASNSNEKTQSKSNPDPGVIVGDKSNGKAVTDADANADNNSDNNAQEVPDDDDDAISESDSDSDSDSDLNSNTIKQQGTAVDLINIQMTNIGFLECHSLSLVLSCNRCKTQNELHNLISGPYARESKATALRCEKCNALLAAAFRKNFLHSHSHNAGYLDLSGCSATDILPSSFTPTCAKCTTSYPQAFRRVEFGKTNNFFCRECHTKLSLLLPEFTFDVISTENLTKDKINANAAKRRNSMQKLGIIGGTPLPNNGSCQHYKKSNRWFRFSCCSKVFPCDKCHDEQSNHTNERAHRMICGKCSREQNFSDTCFFCHHSFDTRHSPFWEGGKGTRDKVKMSRKDPHKYKRVKS